MAEPLRVLLLFASLPTYFPERHGVFDAARRGVAEIAGEHGAEFVVFREVVLNQAGAEIALAYARERSVDFVLVLHGGFTMGDVAHTLAASEFRLGFWAVPEPVFSGDIQLNNFVSLNMSLSIAAGRRDLTAHPAAWYFGAPESDDFRQRFGTTLDALRILRETGSRRVGLVGGVAPTFYNMQVDRKRLARTWNTEVVDIEMAALRAAAGKVRESAVDTAVEEMRAAGSARVPEADMRLSARYAQALVDLAHEHDLHGLAVSDWPDLQADPGFHPGAAFSWVEERTDIAVASEGDVMGALSHLAARAASGKGGCLVDLCAPDPQSGALLAWHGGGGPLHLADGGGVSWIAHPMLGRGDGQSTRPGTIADYRFAPGPVTLARIGRDGTSVFALEAQVVEGPSEGFLGARGWLEDFRVNAEPLALQDVIETVLHHGIEHHFVLMTGHHGSAFAELATWTGAKLQGALRAQPFLSPAEPLKR
ncbi:MAG TPA: hypothetical protein VIL84_11005 [Devosiaceae bacterium]